MFQHYLLKRLSSLFIESLGHLSLKSLINHIFAGLFWILFCSTDVYVYPFASTSLSSLLNHEISLMNPSTFLFQNYFLYWILSFSIFLKVTCWDFNVKCFESMAHFGENWHLSYSKPSNQWYGIVLFFNIYLIDYAITVVPFSPLHSPPPCIPPPTHIPRFSSCPWVVHISSLTSPFPILSYPPPVYFVPPIMFLIPCTFSPILPFPAPYW